jgi:3-mercaptopyruvate sulfurtransferase SseA
MNKRILCSVSLAMVLVLAGFALTACKRSGTTQTSERAQIPQPTNSPALPTDGVRRVTIPELSDALEKGEVVVLDVRGEVEYKLGHIKGARSLPLGLIAQQAGDLPRDRLIVTYCA